MQTTEHLGKRWYVVVKFCETKFAKSELEVYINFVTDIRIVYVFVLSYTPYFHIVKVKYG
jgi:hypothetical protein